MDILNKLRCWLFWALDTFKGGKIRADLNDVNNKLKLTSFELLQEKNKPILEKLLYTASHVTSFYKNYKDFKTLQDFPVVNKTIIRNNFGQININLKESSDFKTVFTSGSSGSPFKVYQSKRKVCRNTADTLFFANSSGFTLGDKLLYLRLWTDYYKKKTIVARIQNIEQIDVLDLSDDFIAKLLIKLQRNKSRKC